MQVIVRLKDPVTSDRGTAARRASAPDELQRIVRSAGASIRPLHAGTADASLASYFVIDVRDAAHVDTLIPLLLQSPLVDAAYAKPPDALP
jgi:hypothetical protein